MKLKNNFTQETRLLFLYCYSCFNCGRSNRGIELHHILGRISNSPFNAIPLCTKCHSEVKHTQEEEAFYFGLSFNFHLKEKVFKPEQEDWDFLKDNGNRLGLTMLNYVGQQKDKITT